MLRSHTRPSPKTGMLPYQEHFAATYPESSPVGKTSHVHEVGAYTISTSKEEKEKSGTTYVLCLGPKRTVRLCR